MAFELCLKTPQHRQSPIEKQVRFQETPNFINVVDYGSAGGLANENFLRYEEVMESDHVILQGGTVDNGWCADIVGGQDDPVRKALIADLEEKKLACQRLTAAKRHFALHSPNSVEDKTLVMRCNQRGKAIDMAAQALGDYDAFKRWRSAPAAERAAMDQGARERASRRNDRQVKKAARRVRLNGLFFRYPAITDDALREQIRLRSGLRDSLSEPKTAQTSSSTAHSNDPVPELEQLHLADSNDPHRRRLVKLCLASPVVKMEE
jgi:hypothetical protein